MKRPVVFAILMLALLLTVTACYAGTRVYVVQKPPPVRVEVIGVAPAADHVWVQGYWVWRDNDYQWVAGHWEKCPKPRAAWVPGHWKHTRHGYHWVLGHWR